MSLETSKKILKIFGIIGIIVSIIAIVTGIMILAGGAVIGVAGMATVGEEAVAMEATGTISAAASIIAIVSGIFALLRSIFSIRAANDTSKIMPAFVFAVIGLISNIFQAISSFASGSGVASAIGSLIIGAVVFYASYVIKKSRA